MNHLDDRDKPAFCSTIRTGQFLDRDALEHIDALEDVVLVGYPNGICDRANNIPIMRRGVTATPVHLDYEGMPAFLIDASVFPGSSGSPVFLYNSGGWSDRGKSFMAGNRLCMLGILAKAFYRRSDGTLSFEEIPASLRPVVKAQEMIDLGVVYKAQTVIETIEHLLRRFGELPASAT